MDNGAESYRRFLDGDDSGMAELIKSYMDGLMLYINSYTQNLGLAEDIVQDTFIKLAIKKPKFRGECSFKTWLYTIGRNVAINQLKKASRRNYTVLDECDNIAAETNLERDYLIEEQKIQLHRSIHKLKAEYQQVLYLFYFEDFNYADIAKIMKKSKKQVENLLYNARKILKSELEKEGFIYEKL